MASGTADLQRDLGGALMTSVLGALLTAGYASAMASAVAASGQNVSESTQAQLQLSFASAADLAANNPKYASQITAAAKQSFLDGDNWAYIAAMVAVIVGASLVFFLFPRKEEEEELRASYHRLDVGGATTVEPPPAPAAPAAR
jgi:protein-S-isoprenylcysteine O-methyltransferase Ste14